METKRVKVPTLEGVHRDGDGKTNGTLDGVPGDGDDKT